MIAHTRGFWDTLPRPHLSQENVAKQRRSPGHTSILPHNKAAPNQGSFIILLYNIYTRACMATSNFSTYTYCVVLVVMATVIACILSLRLRVRDPITWKRTRLCCVYSESVSWGSWLDNEMLHRASSIAIIRYADMRTGEHVRKQTD